MILKDDLQMTEDDMKRCKMFIWHRQVNPNLTQRPPGGQTINNLTCVKNKVDQNHPPIFVNLK